MGQNLSLNIASRQIPISVYNRTTSRVDDTVSLATDLDLTTYLSGYGDLRTFIESLKRPRKIILLVKAGNPVEAVLRSLEDLLEEGDLVIDGGNEYYKRTEERAKRLMEKKGILYMGMGVSGGEEGARYGPSLMPGGPKEGFEMVRGVLEKIAAREEEGVGEEGEKGKCVTYIGEGGSGNYVKMVHNGIEYGDMQLIGESYDLLKSVVKCGDKEMIEIFEEWDREELKSFLIEISANVLKVDDDVEGGGGKLIDKVLDQSGSKGTGAWTIQEAADRGIPIPTIAAALDARYTSAVKEQRKQAAGILKGPDPEKGTVDVDKKQLIDDIRRALYASKICSYAQGMNLIRRAGEDYGWDLDLGEIARIWKGGCIIRAKFLDRIKSAYDRDSNLSSLLVDTDFAKELENAQDAWRRVVSTAVTAGVAVPALSSSLAYYDAWRREVLPSSQMVQAQRDYFGSHTYKRLDREGVYHTRWHSDGVTERTDQ